MASEPNVNEIAAHVIQGLISNSLKSISKAAKDVVSKVLDTMRKNVTIYVNATSRKCSFVRTPIINRDHPTPIGEIYVKTRLRFRKKIVSDTEFVDALTGSDSIVIAGSAGSGKSVFMKYLFLALCNSKRSKIPLFFELRDLNGAQKKDLQEFLYYNLIGPGAVITQEQFMTSLRAGVFSLMLDGFDEINFEDRKNIEQQILRLRGQCPDLQIIISSRPDLERRFETWSSFDVVAVEPMDEQQTLNLVRKLDYNKKIKAQFVKALHDGLFKSHGTFLSNPLLCIMMLVTFEQIGHIPNKRHIFYEKAFDALAFLHDTAKEGVYKRKTYTDLPSDEFNNCLSAFAIVTYLKQKITFSRRELRECLSEALLIEHKTLNLDDLMSDMIESICLIQSEGTDFVFTHRSFQEYFAAVFIARSPAGAASILDRTAQRLDDDVLSMAFGINRGLIERSWILPKFEALLSRCASIDGNAFPLQLAKSLFVGGLFLRVEKGKPAGIHRLIVDEGAQIIAISRLFSERFSGRYREWRKQQKNDLELTEKFLAHLLDHWDPRLQLPKDRSRRAYRVDSFDVHLTEDDNDHLKHMSVVQYLLTYVAAIQEVCATITSEAKSQDDVIARLVSIAGGR
jgi:hypothetical protein